MCCKSGEIVQVRLTRKILVTSDFLLPARLDHAGIRGHEALPGVAWQVSSAHNL